MQRRDSPLTTRLAVLVGFTATLAACKLSNEEFLEAYTDARCRFARECNPNAQCSSAEDLQSGVSCRFDDSKFEECLDELEAEIANRDCENAPNALPNTPVCLQAVSCGTQ